MKDEQREALLRTVAKYVRMIHECPFCAECRKEMASLTMCIPVVLLKSDEQWEHLTSDAIHAFFNVFRDGGMEVTQDVGHFTPESERSATGTPHQNPRLMGPLCPECHTRHPEPQIPDGWRVVANREPRKLEYFLSCDGRVGLQDGYVSFAGRNPERLIVERIATQTTPESETSTAGTPHQNPSSGNLDSCPTDLD
jgi:hypothetical protein